MQGKLSFTGRIATFSFRHKWLVLAAWLLLFVAAGVASTGLNSALTNEQKDLSNSDSAQADALIRDRFGERALTETIITRSETATVDDPAFVAFVDGLAGQLRTLPGVQGVITYAMGDPSMVSADRHAGLTVVMLTSDINQAEKDVEGVLATVNSAAAPDGYTLHLLGTASLNREMNEIANHDIEAAERFGLPVALAVMVIAFGTVIAAIVPLALGFAAIIPAVGTVALVGRAFELSMLVTSIITMIGLAVGIDYSMFVMGRYREELAKGRDRITAMGIAADSSGRAVFFSGITVLLALAGMVIVRNNVFISIGAGAMVVVLYAVIASLTLLPALLAVLGRSINWVRLPFLGRARVGDHLWGTLTHAVQRRPVVFVIVSAGLLLAAALPLTTIDLGSSGAESLPRQTQAYQGIKALERDFAAGRADPILITVDGVDTPSVQEGIARLQQRIAVREDLQWMGMTVDPSGRTALIEVAQRGAGTGSAAQRVVDELRQEMLPAAFNGTGAEVHAGGNLPVFVDVKAEMDSKTPVVFGFVLSLSFILLLLVFRSIAIPAKAILMNLLSVGAAYGLVVLVFQHGVGADLLGFQQVEQVEFWIPLFLFSILFGLSMDYHVFLLSRVQEEYHRTGNNRQAVSTGVAHTAGMITSAAIIMVSVFAGFARGEMVAMQQMGFGLAVSVFLDATVIRSVLVPASMQLLGRYNWWMPSFLGWLPRLSIEGAHEDRRRAPVAVEAAVGD